jgi:homoserine kinase
VVSAQVVTEDNQEARAEPAIPKGPAGFLFYGAFSFMPIEVAVPGSIANLGPGFDALSVAVQIYLRLTVTSVDALAPDAIEWDFAGDAPSGENRIETAYKLARERHGVPAPGLTVRVESEIPQTAGLGSSAAAAVAGLRLYQAVAGDKGSIDLLALATEIEGHPDNAAAALRGGLTVSCQTEDGHVIARSWQWPEALRLVVATPQMPLATSKARGVVPREMTRADAIFNLQRALLFVNALDAGRYEDLREAMRDRWHQPARAPLVPGLAEAIAFDDPAVLGVCLSGAGPSIVALATDGASRAAALFDDLYKRLGMPCTIRVLSAHQP